MDMKKLLLKNGRVIDPANGRDELVDVLIEGELIQAIGSCKPDDKTEVIDVIGKLVLPGLVDLHVHLRDLEQAYKETIETGTRAARRGGVTTVLAMPNTKPALDSKKTIRRYRELIAQKAQVEV